LKLVRVSIPSIW